MTGWYVPVGRCGMECQCPHLTVEDTEFPEGLSGIVKVAQLLSKAEEEWGLTPGQGLTVPTFLIRPSQCFAKSEFVD